MIPDKDIEATLVNLKLFQKINDRKGPALCATVALDVAIQAVNKQKSKKPVYNELFPGWIRYQCPVCESFVGYYDNYCKECGQALDWQKVEE